MTQQDLVREQHSQEKELLSSPHQAPTVTQNVHWRLISTR